MKFLRTLLIAATLAGGMAYAQPAAKAAGSTVPTAEAKKDIAKPAAEMTDGEVRKVDKEAKKITLKHGEIKNLDMPGMTMIFQVKDAALLDTVKAGDKIRFKAESSGGALLVTEIQPAK